MVASWPSVAHPVDDDSVILSHPIYELSSNRSWAKYDHVLAETETEDDELQQEIDMLSSIEREVSQEISDLVISFSKHPEKQKEKQTKTTKFEPGPRKLSSSGSPMNEIYAKLMKREGYMFQEQLILTDEESTRSQNEKKKHDIIQEVKTDMIMNDTRESPGQSQPSDEDYDSVLGLFAREPPEEILFFDDNESGYDDDLDNSFGEVEHHSSKHFREREKEQKSEEMQFISHCKGMGKSTFVERNKDKEQLDMLSEWSLQSVQLSDLEKGEINLFEKEKFWKESFWKTPVSKAALQNPSALDQPEQSDRSESPRRRQYLHFLQSRRAIIEKLSLPTLEYERHKRYKILEKNNEIDQQSLKSWQSGRNLDRVLSKSDVPKELTHCSESMETRPIPSKSVQTLSDMNENQLIRTHNLKYENNHTSAHCVIVPNKGGGVVGVNEKLNYQRNTLCNWRTIVFVVHAILTATGGAVFWLFLQPRDL